MSHPDDDVLVDLALNGPDAAHAPRQSHDHVATCPTCSFAVSELRRTLSLAGPSSADLDWVEPPPALWEAISAQLDRPASPRAVAAPQVRAVPAAADVAALDRRRDRRDGGRRSARPATGRPRLVGWAAGIAAAGLAVGLLTGRALWNDPVAPSVATSTTPPATTVSRVGLNTLDATDPQRLGQAAVVRAAAGYELSIDTAKPVDPGTGYLEVWLINRDLKRMVSVGVLRGDGMASFPISANLIDQGYVVVDISRQQFTESTAHSGDSVMRGELPA